MPEILLGVAIGVPIGMTVRYLFTRYDIAHRPTRPPAEALAYYTVPSQGEATPQDEQDEPQQDERRHQLGDRLADWIGSSRDLG